MRDTKILNKHLYDKGFSKGEQTNSCSVKMDESEEEFSICTIFQNEKKRGGRNRESVSKIREFKHNLSKESAAAGRLQSGGNKGLLGCINKELLLFQCI